MFISNEVTSYFDEGDQNTWSILLHLRVEGILVYCENALLTKREVHLGPWTRKKHRG